MTIATTPPDCTILRPCDDEEMHNEYTPDCEGCDGYTYSIGGCVATDELVWQNDVLDKLALARKALDMLRRADSAQLKAFWREIADSADIAYFEARENLARAMATYDTPMTGGAA